MREGAHTLITGGAGFIGANLADALLQAGERVVLLDNFSRDGVARNAEWLKGRHGAAVRIEVGDVADARRVASLVKDAKRVYHLAAQVAVTTSVADPWTDLRDNLLGTFNVLEAARSQPDPPAVLFTSTNKVYGDLDGVAVSKDNGRYRYRDGRRGIAESTPLDFHSPYGCSKGSADQYVRDYARIYGLPTVVFRMSCIYGTRQFGTEDQGWVAHFARSLLSEKPITIYGDGCQVRDLLWVEDLIVVMKRAMDRAELTPGEVFNIGGGAENAASVARVIERLTEITGTEVPVRYSDWRPGDQRIYVSDTAKAERALEWRPRTAWETGLERLVEWLEEAGLGLPALSFAGGEGQRRKVGAAI